MSLSLSDFQLAGLAFEVRHPEAYLLWDRAGRLTREIQSKCDVSRVIGADPGKVVFRASATREITWQLDRFAIVEFKPPSSQPEEFYNFCEFCFDTTTLHLQLSELRRVGFRLTFSKVFATTDDAAAALSETTLARVPEGKHFNVDPIHTNPEYGIRRDGEKFGYYLKITVQTVKFEFEHPPQWRGNDVASKEEHLLVFDLDWYTTAPMATGALRVSEWLSQILHAVRRDADGYLER